MGGCLGGHVLHSGRDKCEVFIVMYQGGRTGPVKKLAPPRLSFFFFSLKTKQNKTKRIYKWCRWCMLFLLQWTFRFGFYTGFKNGKAKCWKARRGERAPARGERDYTGLRGELALYRHTDAPITEQSRVVLLLALKTWPRAFNVRCLGLGFVCRVVACVICRVCERRPFTSTASSRIRLFSFFLSRFLLIKLLLNGSTSVVPCSADRMVCVERLIERERSGLWNVYVIEGD